MTNEQKNCKYCHGTDRDEFNNREGAYFNQSDDAYDCIYINLTDSKLTVWREGLYGDDSISYCPKCGRKLNDE